MTSLCQLLWDSAKGWSRTSSSCLPFLAGDNLQFAIGSKKKERKQLVQTSSTTSTTWPHTPTSNCVSSPFLPHFFPRHRDHHLLPCDATQLLVALPQGVGRKVKPSSKATWWKSSSWNRKAAETGRVWNWGDTVIIPGGLEKQKTCMIL